MNADEAYLVDILEASRRAVRHTGDVTFAQFDKDYILQLAITHLVQIVGEASAHITQETREKFPDIPWRQIVGLRHRIVHEYFSIDVVRVWDIVQNHLPVLIEQLQEYREDASREGQSDD